MKKIFTILLVLALLTLTFCGCAEQSDQPTNGDTQTVATSSTTALQDTIDRRTNSDIQTITTSSTTALQDKTMESLTEKLEREIESAYKAELELPENSSTAGMVDVVNKHTDKWKQVADEYYKKIMAYDGITPLDENYYSSEDLHTFVSNMKTGWEKYYAEQCTNYVKTLQAIYQGGTIVGPIAADAQYNLQKEWALRLVGIYQQLPQE